MIASSEAREKSNKVVDNMEVEPEDGNSSSTPTTDPIPLPQMTPSAWSSSQSTDAAVVVPKATMLGTGLDQVSPQHAEKAQPVTPLAGVYTPSVPQPQPDDLLSKLAALLQPIQADIRDMKTRVTKIKLGDFTTQYNAFSEPEYDTWGGSADVGHVTFDCGGEQEPLSGEQQAYLEQAKAMANFDDLQNTMAWEQQ